MPNIDGIGWISLFVSVILPLAILIIPKGILITKIEKEMQGSVSPSNYLANFAPFINSYRMYEEASEKKSWPLRVFSVITWVALVATAVVRLFFSQDIKLNLYVTLGILGIVFINYVIDVVLAYYVANLIGSGAGKVFALIPMMSFYFTSNKVRKFFEDYKDEIIGTFGDTDGED